MPLTDTKELSFEQGPIRPPNEARSLLLRFTRNCPWNRCRFCPVYKNSKFSLRAKAEIKQDIETVRGMIDEIKTVSFRLGYAGTVNDAVLHQVLQGGRGSPAFRTVAAWLYYGTGACFLQDADNLIMKTDDLAEALAFLRKTLPEVQRVTTYSRSLTVSRKSADSLLRIREAGLDRIHIGLETGYDPLLKKMQKGVTAAKQVEAGRKVIAAGLELSEYVMPGLGGQEMWRSHALETARVLNAINPHFIRLRSLRVPPRIPLHQDLIDGSFTLQTDDMLAEEIRVFIDALDGITSTVTSDHIMNLLEEVSGTLPGDKERMLEVIARYQALSENDRLIYRIGRRGGAYRSTEDLRRDPATYDKLNRLLKEVESRDGRPGVEKFITELADQYI